MRYYGFTNMYLSSIQHGIQNFHVLGEMFTKYNMDGGFSLLELYRMFDELLRNAKEDEGKIKQVEMFRQFVIDNLPLTKSNDTTESNNMLFDWARNHKTCISLNGGNQSGLIGLKQFFEREDNPFPWATFNEDEQSLNGCLTGVGIILPERIYDTATKIKVEAQLFLLNREAVAPGFTEWEIELMLMLPTFRLAA